MKREYSIDLIRVVSCALVVLAHCLLVSIHQSPEPLDQRLSSALELVIALTRWVVPAFMMITGYFIAKRKECTYSYCFTHIKRFVAALFTIGLGFALLELFFYERTINAAIIGKAFLNVLTGRLWDHMWYVYTIIGIYLVLPVIHTFLQQDLKKLITLTVLLYIFTILIPYLDHWIEIGIRMPFDGYLFFVFFGGLAAKIDTKKEWRIIYIAIIVLCIACIAVFQKVAPLTNSLHPVVCIQGMAIFLLMRDLNVKPSKPLVVLSGLTWGVYLIHPLFVNLAVKVLGFNILGPLGLLKLLVFFILMNVISFGTVFILKKVPLAKQII